MNRKLIFKIFILWIFSCYNLMGQKFTTASIPDSLAEGVDAVIRIHEQNCVINNIKSASYTEKLVVTVLNNKGQHWARRSIFYDQFIKIRSLEARVYDSRGFKIEELKKSDIDDVSDYTSYDLFDDTRYKTIDMRQKHLPYTFELIYKVDYTNLYYTRDWIAQPWPRTSVEKSIFTIKAPMDLHPRTKVEQSEHQPVVSEVDGIVTSQFEFGNLKGIHREPYGPTVSELSPKVRIAPTKFNFGGFEGDMSTWDAIAEWQRKLNRGLQTVSESTKRELDILTIDLKDDESKARAVYEYMQERTRYVSIQLGIGGFQPFPALTVEEKGYGDCKALSNYTQALLGHVGVKSYYTWIFGGANPPKVDPDFPDDSFNHIILCVPNKGDTLWLECTSQQNPFGYLGRQTGDRDVLIITETGGKLGHTTVYDASENTQFRHAQVNIERDGNGLAKVNTTYKGIQYENNGLNYYVEQNSEEQRKWVLKNIDIPNFQLQDYQFTHSKSKNPYITQDLSLSLENYAQTSGKRIFLPVNLMNVRKYVPKKLEVRKSDIILRYGYQDKDSIVYVMPQGIHPEHVPQGAEFISQFGSYKTTISVDDNKVIYVRQLSINKGTYPSTSYGELREFFRKVSRSDKAKVVFLNST